jgi:hypothetical protein
MGEREVHGLVLVEPSEVGRLSGAGRRQKEEESRERGDDD